MTLSPSNGRCDLSEVVSPNTAPHAFSVGSSAPVGLAGDFAAVLADEENTRHLALCGAGGQTAVRAGSSSLAWGKLKRLKGPVCPMFVPGPSSSLFGALACEGPVLVARQPTKWWAVALWGRGGAVCAVCGRCECLAKTVSNRRWLRLTRGGNLSEFLAPPLRTAVDDWVDASLSAHARGETAPSEILYRLDATELRDSLSRVAAAEP